MNPRLFLLRLGFATRETESRLSSPSPIEQDRQREVARKCMAPATASLPLRPRRGQRRRATASSGVLYPDNSQYDARGNCPIAGGDISLHSRADGNWGQRGDRGANVIAGDVWYRPVVVYGGQVYFMNGHQSLGSPNHLSMNRASAGTQNRGCTYSNSGSRVSRATRQK